LGEVLATGLFESWRLGHPVASGKALNPSPAPAPGKAKETEKAAAAAKEKEKAKETEKAAAAAKEKEKAKAKEKAAAAAKGDFPTWPTSPAGSGSDQAPVLAVFPPMESLLLGVAEWVQCNCVRSTLNISMSLF